MIDYDKNCTKIDRIELIPIPVRFTAPQAVIAAMAAASHDAVARVAEGALWEDEPGMKLNIRTNSVAKRLSRLWWRQAEFEQTRYNALRPKPTICAEPSHGAAQKCPDQC